MRPPTPEELAVARRVWRLAVLITADQERARRAIALVPPPPRGEGLDAQRLDRLAIQAIRRTAGPGRRPRAADITTAAPAAALRGAEHDEELAHRLRAAVGAAPGRPLPEPSVRLSLGAAHEVVATLPLQSAEVWVLRRLDDLDPIRACRAMDCSRSAGDRFLARADADLALILGPALDDSIRELRARADALLPDAPVVAACVERARRSMRRTVAIALATAAGTLAIILALASLATP